VKILLDENLPRPLRQFFPADELTTVQEAGWAGCKNGDLLAKAEGKYDVFVIADKNLRYQQNLTDRQLAIVELPTNRWPVLKQMASRIAATVKSAQPGTYTVVTE
jgi:hypothetical protein